MYTRWVRCFLLTSISKIALKTTYNSTSESDSESDESEIGIFPFIGLIRIDVNWILLSSSEPVSAVESSFRSDNSWNRKSVSYSYLQHLVYKYKNN